MTPVERYQDPPPILAALGAWMGHWVSDREPPTTVIRTELIPLKPYPGGEVQVRYFVRRYRACATRVERLLFDAQQLRIPLPVRDFATSPGPVGDDSYVVSVPIPDSAMPGPARYRILTTYVCNPWHNIVPIVVSASDVMFTIQPRPQ
jgi:hypothetical protein